MDAEIQSWGVKVPVSLLEIPGHQILDLADHPAGDAHSGLRSAFCSIRTENRCFRQEGAREVRAFHICTL